MNINWTMFSLPKEHTTKFGIDTSCSCTHKADNKHYDFILI